MLSLHIAKRILPAALMLSVLLFGTKVSAECALVLTSPTDGAVFTGTGNQITITAMLKPRFDPIRN